MRTKLVVLLSVLALVGSTAGTSTADGEGPSARRQVMVPQETTPRIAELAGFAIHATGTDQCLAAEGTAVVLVDCAYEPRQRWYFHDLGDANYLIQNGGGGVLAADPVTNCCNGTALRLSEHVPGDTNQEWLHWDDGTRLGFQNNYSYRNLAAGDDEVRLWDYRREDTAQHWRLELAE